MHRLLSRQVLALVFICVAALWSAGPATAHVVIRDGDIEHALGQLARPILRAAGLPADQTRVLIIQDGRMNAFVIDRDHIFVHSGLLLRLTRAEQLQAVLAHEAAHIANGHMTRRMANIRTANTVAMLGSGLAMAAAAAGGNGAAAAGVALGVASSAERRLFSHTRAEESAADAAALRYLRAAGVDLAGYLEVLALFKNQELLMAERADPYALTHPLSRDRLRAVAAQSAALPTNAAAASPNAAYWFDRAKGKLAAFTQAPAATLRATGRDLGDDPVTLLRQAAAWHRLADAGRARAAIDRAIAITPDDAYLHDLKGQILLESRAAPAAVAAYGRAAALAPGDAQVLAGLGRAQLVAGQPAQAIATLERARARDPSNAAALRDRANAYAQQNRPGDAALVTAERYLLLGRPKDAKANAARATGLLPRGSAAWLRAQDALAAAEIEEKRQKRQ